MDLYWRQGFVIKDAKSVKGLPLDMIAKLQEEEEKKVYRNFTVKDEGKSRELVGVFSSAHDAALAVKLYNAALKDTGYDIIILNAGWNFKERNVRFQSIHSSWAKARDAIIDIQNNQNNVYNFIELTQATIDGHSFRAQEIWKLHNGQFYRDSLSIS